MQREERAIVTPAAKVLLVALLVTVARSESREEPAADFEFEPGNALLNRLAALSLAELDRLAETGALKVVVSCAGDQLSWSLQALARKRSEQALLEYFVRHGAPRTLVRELFTISRGRIDAVRKSLRIASVQGRPKLPPLREREGIVAAWIRLEGTEDRRARYHALHRNFPGYSIAALDSVLQELSPERSATPPPAGNRPAAAPLSGPRARQPDEPAARRRTVVRRRVPR
jgi:hypothetical protein